MILCIVIMDVTTPINCQVGTVSYFHSLGFRPATHFKLWTVFSVVSTLSYAIRLRRGENAYHLFFPSYFYVYRRPFLRY